MIARNVVQISYADTPQPTTRESMIALPSTSVRVQDLWVGW